MCPAVTNSRIPHIDILGRHVEIAAESHGLRRVDAFRQPAGQAIKPGKLGLIENGIHASSVGRIQGNDAHPAGGGRNHSRFSQWLIISDIGSGWSAKWLAEVGDNIGEFVTTRNGYAIPTPFSVMCQLVTGRIKRLKRRVVIGKLGLLHQENVRMRAVKPPHHLLKASLQGIDVPGRNTHAPNFTPKKLFCSDDATAQCEEMELIFLLFGLVFIAVGCAIAVSEVRARAGTQRIDGRVVGFSTGHRNKPTSPSFRPVVQYVGTDGRTYYVEGAVGSSVPLHTVGDTVAVLVNSEEPQKAVLKSALSFVLAGAICLMGLVSVMVFRFTFRPNLYSLVMAAFLFAIFAFKVKQAWRKSPLSMAAWQEYKKQIFGPKVFTEESKDRISWADPIGITVAIKNYEKSNRFAIPLLFAIGLSALFGGHYFHQRTDTFIESADRTAGRVVDLKEKDAYSSDPTTWAAVVEFHDSRGETHQFVDSFSASTPLYDVGEPVNVLYDSRSPLKARIDRGRWNYWPSIILYSAGGLFVLMGAHSLRRRARITR